jgi:ABC-type uncharacterized transport system auxiliary subunit
VIYEKALAYARAIDAHDYIASIAYSAAMLSNENGQVDNARAFVAEASASAPNVSDNELKREISALLKALKTT